MLASLALFFFFGGMGGTSASTGPKKAESAYQLVYRQDRLTVKTDRTPLVQLVEEIAAAAGIEIVTASRLYADQLVAADIQDGSVVKVIQALLAGHNYLIFFSADSQRQGLHLLSGTMSAPVGEKLLVLTENGGRYQLVTGCLPPPAAKGKAEGMNAKVPGLSGRVKTPEDALSLRAHGNRGQANLFRPANVYDKKEEKCTMDTRETSYSEGRTVGKNATSLSGTGNSLSADNGEGMEEYGDAAASNESLAGVHDNDPEEDADDSFAREAYLRYQIDKLTARIESGNSDRQFEFWAQKKNSKYVTNDRDLLNQYEKELRAMEDKE
ncbi:MAG: hypothetical protein M0P70_04755 [Desulfobulbaceae bacterium]|nr:hypothetical protein [Desulfobulbaceae bacterium]